jgi:DNA-binding NtrC family response regulator
MKKGHLLIIDDESHLLNVLSFMFSDLAQKITVVETAPEALKILDSEKLDCILCDMNLPRMSGLEILKLMREKGMNTAFIFFSAENRSKAVHEAVKLGAMDFFFKPQFTGIDRAIKAALNDEPYEVDPASEFGKILLTYKS